MTTDLISLLIVLGWLSATIIAIGLIAMINFVGSRYVFSTPGLMRTGPKIGSSLPRITIRYRGLDLPLEELVSKEHPTCVVFLNALAKSSLNLVPDLVNFSSLTKDHLSFLVLCKGFHEKIADLERFDSDFRFLVVGERDVEVTARIGIRAVPYALVLDEQANVVAKGLVNHIQHLCMLTGEALSRINHRSNGQISQICQPYMQGIVNWNKLPVSNAKVKERNAQYVR